MEKVVVCSDSQPAAACAKWITPSSVAAAKGAAPPYGASDRSAPGARRGPAAKCWIGNSEGDHAYCVVLLSPALVTTLNEAVLYDTTFMAFESVAWCIRKIDAPSDASTNAPLLCWPTDTGEAQVPLA